MNDTQGLLSVPIMKLILPPNGTHRDGVSRFYVFGSGRMEKGLDAAARSGTLRPYTNLDTPYGGEPNPERIAPLTPSSCMHALNCLR